MPCGCGGGQQVEQWEAVKADGTVGLVGSKEEATQYIATEGSGSYIRQKR